MSYSWIQKLVLFAEIKEKTEAEKCGGSEEGTDGSKI